MPFDLISLTQMSLFLSHFDTFLSHFDTFLSHFDTFYHLLSPLLSIQPFHPMPKGAWERGGKGRDTCQSIIFLT